VQLFILHTFQLDNTQHMSAADSLDVSQYLTDLHAAALADDFSIDARRRKVEWCPVAFQ